MSFDFSSSIVEGVARVMDFALLRRPEKVLASFLGLRSSGEGDLAEIVGSETMNALSIVIFGSHALRPVTLYILSLSLSMGRSGGNTAV